MKQFLKATVAILAICASNAVLAQTSTADDTLDSSREPSVGPDQDSGEIVVTASRRNESIARVPISIAVATQASLDQRGVRDILDLARTTPSLQLRQGGQGSNYVAIRGITSNVGASTTGVYIDDTAIQARAIGAGNATSTTFPALFDLERVEVLRGPQGTLFGAGSEGGTVRFIQPEPSLADYTGYGRAEVASTKGGDSSGEAGAAFGGPIVKDVLGFRASGYIRRDGGWVDRRPISGGPGRDNENDRQTVSLRAALAFAPTDRIKIIPAILYQDVDGYGSADTWDILSDAGNGGQVTGNEIREKSSDRFFLPSLKIAVDVGAVSIVSNTAYLDRRSTIGADYTAFVSSVLSGGTRITPPGLPGFVSVSSFQQKQQVFSQELRIQNSDTAARLTWVVGAFYQHARQSVAQSTNGIQADAASVAFSGRTILQRYGRAPLAGDVLVATYDEAIDEQIAGFGQVDFKLLPWLKLTAGVRVAATRFTFENAGSGPLNGGNTATSGRQTEKPITPKFGLSVQLDDANLLYATAAKGFRTGGANAAISTATCSSELSQLGFSAAPNAYNSDSVWSYEVGTKNRFLSNKVRVAASAFYIDWKNIQQRVSLGCGFSFTTNLGSAVSKGGDLQVEVTPIRGLDLSAAAAYTHAAYSDTILGGVTNAATGARSTIVSADDRLPTPPWTVTLGAAYTTTINRNEVYARADYNYASDYQFLPRAPSVSFDSSLFHAESNHYVNTRIGVSRDAFDLSLFANNLLNSSDVVRETHVSRTAPMVRQLIVRPRTIGVTLSYRL